MAYILPSFDDRGYLDIDSMPSTLALNISYSINEYFEKHSGQQLTLAHIMAFTQRSWKLSPEEANAVELILGSANRYINAYLPDTKNGESNPVRYFKQH